MKNNKGLAEVAVLYVVIAGLFALFVPNPISASLGVGIRPNKTIEKQYDKERVELLKDKDGNIVAVKTKTEGGTSNLDKQQGVSLWEQLRSLPVLFMLLIAFGVLFPVFGARLWAVYKGAKKELFGYRADTKKIVKGLDNAFATVPLTLAGTNLPGEIDRAALAEKIVDAMKAELGDTYNDSTKELVKKIRAS